MVVHQYVKTLLDLENAVVEFEEMGITVRTCTAADNPDETKAPHSASDSKPIFIIVSGEKDATGKSWCPDCVKAEPVLEAAALELAPENALFLTVHLPRDEWKNKSCVFRTDSRFRLSSIPSLLKWPNAQPKLEEGQCADFEALKDFFEECA